MIPLSTQQEVGALIIGIFGRLPTVSEIDYYDSQFDISSQPPAYMASILMSQPDADWMNGQSEYDILTSVYLSVYNAYPDPDYINELLMQGHFNSAIASVVIDLFNYLGDDPLSSRSVTHWIKGLPRGCSRPLPMMLSEGPVMPLPCSTY